MNRLQLGYIFYSKADSLETSGALIAVIEDEVDLLELLEYHLKKEGYDVEGFTSTKNVRKFLEEEQADLLIVDRNLPGKEGSEFVQELRNDGIEVPVIFLSAKGSEEDIRSGFLRGGDDYIAKPFNMSELLLRVRAILRRTKKEVAHLKHRDIFIDLDKREVKIEKKRVELTKLEFELLRLFVKNAGVVLSREQILQEVWEDPAQERSVNVAIKRLKEKIDPKRSKNYIESIRGVGYKLV
jgi:DNA-binding response OmpR family regulator